MKSPSPEPPMFMARLSKSRVNLLKSLGISSSRIPMPSSWTETLAFPSLSGKAITANGQPGLDAHANWMAARIGLKVVHDFLDELRQVETLEVVGELVVFDPVDGRKVLHQAGQAGGAPMDPIDEGSPGFLVEPMLLGEQGIGLGLDAGQRCLQLVGHHRDEVRADLV